MSSRSRAVAVGNDPVGQEAATEWLLGGGSALGAVISGFFAAAGAHSGVLFSPLTLLAGGVGTGVRVFDGRLRQPGLGARRPRGFVEDGAIPGAAYVAVPGAVAAAVVAQTYEGERSLGAVMRRGILHARSAGADARAGLLLTIRGLGAAAFADPSVVRPLIQIAGQSEMGQLTAADLAVVPMDVDHAAVPHPDAPGWWEAPWAGEGGKDDPSQALSIVLCAADGRGGLAAACFQRVLEGIAVDALEVVAPGAAIPVRRGITRTAPGERLSTRAPLAIKVVGGAPTEIVASPKCQRLTPEALNTPTFRLARDHATRVVTVHVQGGGAVDK
jgi:hypothetical protein